MLVAEAIINFNERLLGGHTATILSMFLLENNMKNNLMIKVGWNPIALSVLTNANHPIFNHKVEEFETKHICNYQGAEVYLYKDGLGWKLNERSNYMDFNHFVKGKVLDLEGMCNGMMDIIEDFTIYNDN